MDATGGEEKIVGSIDQIPNGLTIGYTFADPRQYSAHSAIRVERRRGVDTFTRSFKQDGWDTNQKIVAIEEEQGEAVTSIATLFHLPE